MTFQSKKSPRIKYKIISGIFFSLIVFSCNTVTEKPAPVVEIVQGQVPPPPHSHDTSDMLKESEVIDYIKTASTILPDKNTGIPFDTMDYDKIIAYDFEGSEEPYPSIIDTYGKFVPVVLKQQALTQSQAKNILSALAKNSTYGETTALCFNPHLALVFFKNNSVIKRINICLDCNYLQSDIKIPAETHHMIKLEDGSDYPQRGFTASGEKAIIDLCRELDFFYGVVQ